MKYIQLIIKGEYKLIFNVEEFKKEINDTKEYTNDTIRTYKSCLNNLNNECNKDVTSKKISKFLENLITYSNKSKYISAIKKYEYFFPEQAFIFDDYDDTIIEYIGQKKSSKGLMPSISKDAAIRKISGLKDKKLKYSLRLQIESGLRVFEISNLKKSDIIFEDDKIKINVINGKGGKNRTVNVMDCQYLFEKLNEFLEFKKDTDKLFFQRDYLRKQAAKYGIKSHDLRRLNACYRLDKYMEKDKIGKREAINKVKLELGHDNIKETLKYLRMYFEGEYV